jgi:hypothetical protein
MSGMTFFEALAGQTEMGWTPQQAAEAFAAAMTPRGSGLAVCDPERKPLREPVRKSVLPQRFARLRIAERQAA